jgi:hypothetical protein
MATTISLPRRRQAAPLCEALMPRIQVVMATMVVAPGGPGQQQNLAEGL